jgi:hypothetical protein
MTIFVQIDPADHNRIIGTFDCPQPSISNVYEIDHALVEGIAQPCYDPQTGTVTEHPVPPVQPVPASISPRQARLILLQNNLLTAVEAAIAASSAEIQIEWEYATEIRRDSPTVAAIGVYLGLTDNQIDDMFRSAAVL